MHILALNCGSSSIKSALIDTRTGRRMLEIGVENIGSDHVQLHVDGAAHTLESGTSLEVAVERLLAEYRQRLRAEIRVEAVAHRIVHGGERFQKPTLIDDSMLEEIEALNELAPLHNPPAVAAVHRARQMLPGVPQVAIFDTAFHTTLPDRAREYALPEEIRTRFGIRRFGFHGINHSHVAHSIANHLQQPVKRLRIISCHLGNGASIAAIENGVSVETSMGMTPMEGLVMGTRAGDIDAGVLLHLLRSGEFDVDRLDDLLNRQSGLKGLAGTNDLREIENRMSSGDEEARRALSIYVHRIRKYIGAYAAIMRGVDVIAFTGGAGENSALIRHRCIDPLEFIGALLNERRNRLGRVSEEQPVRRLDDDASLVHIYAVRADEEREIARQAASLLRPEPSDRQAAMSSS